MKIEKLLPDRKIQKKLTSLFKKEVKLIGQLVPHRGHHLYEINPETGEINEVEFDKTVYEFEKSLTRKTVKTKPNRVYISALNKENALRKFKKNQ